MKAFVGLADERKHRVPNLAQNPAVRLAGLRDGREAVERGDGAVEEAEELVSRDVASQILVLVDSGQDEHVAELSEEGGQWMRTGDRRGVGM